MPRYRIYLFAGLGLLLLSMPVTAFVFGDSGTDSFQGWMVWYLSIGMGISPGGGGSPIFTAMFICALFNLWQLVHPFLRNPEAGTSLFWVWWFSFIAFLLLPALALFWQLSEDRNPFIFREGYFIYQAGYIVSALGFHLKRKALLAAEQTAVIAGSM